MTRSIASMKMQPETNESLEDEAKLLRPNNGSGQSDVKEVPTFQSEGRHTDTSPEDLSQRWHISVAQAAKTLKTTHNTEIFEERSVAFVKALSF